MKEGLVCELKILFDTLDMCIIWSSLLPFSTAVDFVCLFGFNVAFKHLRSYRDGAFL